MFRLRLRCARIATSTPRCSRDRGAAGRHEGLSAEHLYAIGDYAKVEYAAVLSR
jgi:hypothetical protein